jgi:DNA repair protein RadA
MVDSPHHPEQEVIFALSEAGVVDPEDGVKKKKTIPKKADIETTDSEKKNTTIKVEPEKTETENE